jgi:hypothetical protein
MPQNAINGGHLPACTSFRFRNLRVDVCSGGSFVRYFSLRPLLVPPSCQYVIFSQLFSCSVNEMRRIHNCQLSLVTRRFG